MSFWGGIYFTRALCRETWGFLWRWKMRTSILWNFRSRPLSWWCHPTISSSVVHFFCLWSFPASGSFPVSQFFASGGQSIGISASASVLPMNIQDWFPLELIGLISLIVQGTLKSHLQHHSSKASVLRHSTFFMVKLSRLYMTTGKAIPLTRQTFVGKAMSLLFNILSQFVIAFLRTSVF